MNPELEDYQLIIYYVKILGTENNLRFDRNTVIPRMASLLLCETIRNRNIQNELLCQDLILGVLRGDAHNAIHETCMNGGDAEHLQILLRDNPEGYTMPTQKGHTPLRLCLVNQTYDCALFLALSEYVNDVDELSYETTSEYETYVNIFSYVSNLEQFETLKSKIGQEKTEYLCTHKRQRNRFVKNLYVN